MDQQEERSARVGGGPSDELESLEDFLYAVVTAEADPDTMKALRAAYRWGRIVGYRAGYDRSFEIRHTKIAGPSFEELMRLRGEERDGHGGFRTRSP